MMKSKSAESKWFGCFHKYAVDKEHDMGSILSSIGKHLGAIDK